MLDMEKVNFVDQVNYGVRGEKFLYLSLSLTPFRLDHLLNETFQVLEVCYFLASLN